MRLLKAVVVDNSLFAGMACGAGYVVAILFAWGLFGGLPLHALYWFGLAPLAILVGVLLLPASRTLSWLMMGFGFVASTTFAALFLIVYLIALASGSLGG